jgi:hypothetical protein
MATKVEAKRARKKFKKEFWAKNQEKYNILGIDFQELVDEKDEPIEDWFVVAYLFDIKDADGLPNEIDGVEIEYLPVINPKDESEQT